MLLAFIVFVVILGLLVFIHELGHFVTAKKSGVKVEEFGFGLPPRIFGIYKDKKLNTWRKVGVKTHITPETIYSLNWIPLGGSVKIKGEQGENAHDTDSFGSKSISRRILIISAGVIMNIFLAVFLFFIGYIKVSLKDLLRQGKPSIFSTKEYEIYDDKFNVKGVILSTNCNI